jgi:hypothetical protein
MAVTVAAHNAAAKDRARVHGPIVIGLFIFDSTG